MKVVPAFERADSFVKSVILKYLTMVVFREPFSIEIDPLQCDSLYCALFFFKTTHHQIFFIYPFICNSVFSILTL